jgi:2'-5' RNA ligase
MEKILALVVKDYYIASILKYLQNILSDYPIKSPPHITIRGPYTDKHISKNIIDNITALLKNMGNIIISRVDYFVIDDELFNVYFSVLNGDLKKITRKRDYPMYRFGFNPHVTLCKTNNFDRAEKIKDIFNKNKIEFVINSDNFQLLTFEIGKIYKEFDFYEYATEEVLINENDYFKSVINLVKDAFPKI